VQTLEEFAPTTLLNLPPAHKKQTVRANKSLYDPFLHIRQAADWLAPKAVEYFPREHPVHAVVFTTKE
jgi:hypothetical protein